MFFIIDMHTHTTASTDAYSTLMDYVRFAKEHSITGFGISDYGPDNISGPTESYFNNINELPRFIDDVLILKGVDSKIIDFDGNLDIKEEQMKYLDYAIVSFDDHFLAPRTETENTRALIHALNQTKVRILSDLANEKYPININELVLACKSANVAIEISNKRLLNNSNDQNHVNLAETIKLAYKEGVALILNSDAHYHASLANFDECFRFMDRLGIPRDYAINYNYDSFFEWLAIDGIYDRQ